MYPLSKRIPSVSSSSRPKVLLSSTVITPSLPTLSIASAIISPIAVSPAEMEAVEAICSLVSTSFASLESSSLTRSTAASMPRLSDIGLAPAATLRRPSRTSAWASTVAVVVPSPATSSVFFATSLTSSAPIFSHGSSSSISLAMDTPSLVIVGAPHFFSRTTLRPLGPRVTFTASASWFIPRSRPRLASSLNAIIFAAIGSSPPWRTRGSSRRPRRPASHAAIPSCRATVPHRPIPPSCWHSHAESASTMFSTLIVRVQTPRTRRARSAVWASESDEAAPRLGSGTGQPPRYPPAAETARSESDRPGPEGAGPASLTRQIRGPARTGPGANLRDHDDLVGLRAPIALRDLELDPLALFEGAVSVRLDRREVDENVLATVDGNEAVSLVRVKPLDGALSHSKQLPNCARASSPALVTAEPVDRGPAETAERADAPTPSPSDGDRN